MDRISDLPDPIIQDILVRLPLYDAVRTSSLSSNWNSRWRKLSILRVDRLFYFALCKPTRPDPSVYRDVVNNLLLQHTGSHITDFSLFIPYVELPNSRYFHHAIRFVLRQGLKYLCIVKVGSGFYPLPFEVFSSVQLTYLHLRNCVFDPPPSFSGFPNLTTLSIVSCLVPAYKLSSYISSCPRLETLWLQRLNFPNDNLDIHATKLHNLRVSGVFKSLLVRSGQSIQYLYVYLNASPDEHFRISASMSKFFSGMGKLKDITLGGRFNKLLASSGALNSVPRLDLLRKLEFSDVHLLDADEILCLSKFLDSSSHLKEFKISLKAASLFDMDIGVFFIGRSFNCLQRIELGDIYSGSKIELKLVEAFLLCSPALEKMQVTICESVGMAEEKRIMMQMLSYSRASGKAKVVIIRNEDPFSLVVY